MAAQTARDQEAEVAKIEQRYDEERDVYEVGFEAEGAFIVTNSVPGSDVRAQAEAAKAEAAKASPGTSAE